MQESWIAGEGFDNVVQVLKSVRSHLGMDVAFVSEFVGENRVFRYLDTDSTVLPFCQGDTSPLRDSYCVRVVDGRLPQLMTDAREVPEAASLEVTRSLPVGAHLSVPLRLADGRLYGTFCCFSHGGNASLNQRDLKVMRAFADVAARQIDRDIRHSSDRQTKTERVRSAIRTGGPRIVYQPIFLLSNLALSGTEALSRFANEPMRTPDRWFDEAAQVGLQAELELAACRNALVEYREVWREYAVQLGLNVSAATLLTGRVADLFPNVRTDRIVIELTEHDRIENYGPLLEALAPLRACGMKIAIDDVGAGHSSMRHILMIRPDIIKLDMSLTRDIDTDVMRRALSKALIQFAHQFDCKVVAEGVETAGELAALRELEVEAAQGFHLGRPDSVAHLLARLRSTEQQVDGNRSL